MRNIPFVIPVHNRLDYTKACLQLLEEQKNTKLFQVNNIQIVIVDDGSTDGTGAWIRDNYPEVIVLRGDGNLWYTGGVNMGLTYALDELDADFIMVWETDAVPAVGYFDHLQTIIESWDGETVICSKVVYSSSPDTILSMGGTFNPRTGKKTLIGIREKDRPEFLADMEVDWFSGHGILIHKEIIRKVGYMDEKNFPQYHSDVDYGLRCKKAGYRNVVFHNLKLLHDTATTGIMHKKDKSCKDFLRSLTLINSNLNIRRDILFYRKHTTSLFAYTSLIRKYAIYTGSFLKWKVLGWFGIRKKDDGLY